MGGRSTAILTCWRRAFRACLRWGMFATDRSSGWRRAWAKAPSRFNWCTRTWRGSEMDLAQQLKTVPVFAELADEDLAWLAGKMEVGYYNPGDVIATEGAPADRMWVI